MSVCVQCYLFWILNLPLFHNWWQTFMGLITLLTVSNLDTLNCLFLLSLNAIKFCLDNLFWPLHIMRGKSVLYEFLSNVNLKLSLAENLKVKMLFFRTICNWQFLSFTDPSINKGIFFCYINTLGNKACFAHHNHGSRKETLSIVFP